MAILEEARKKASQAEAEAEALRALQAARVLDSQVDLNTLDEYMEQDFGPDFTPVILTDEDIAAQDAELQSMGIATEGQLHLQMEQKTTRNSEFHAPSTTRGRRREITEPQI